MNKSCATYDCSIRYHSQEQLRNTVHRGNEHSHMHLKHHKTNLQQRYDIRQVYDRCTIKRDLQKIVQESYEKHTTKLRHDSIKHTCSNYFDFSLLYDSHIVP